MKKQLISDYQQAVNYILNMPRFVEGNSLEGTGEILRRMQHPERKSKVIHVAGTNGKGSVCAYLRSILEAAGYRVGVFISPHLVDIRERFLIHGEMVSKEDFLQSFQRIWELLGDYRATFSEYLFFMAMDLFARAKLDYIILETGLGGRLDATNSVEQKALTIITKIGMDHMEYLGNTLGSIAYEKAGILRKNTPAVFWDGGSLEVKESFCQRAEELGIKPCFVSKKNYAFGNFQNKSIAFSLDTRYYNYISLSLHTAAFYQMENCALAVRGIEEMDKGKTISADAVIKGVYTCFWEGRMEEVLPNVFVDGAHNEDGIEAFTESVRRDAFLGKRTLLLSIVKDKQYSEMIRHIRESGLFDKICITTLHTGRSLSMQQLTEAVQEIGEQVISYPDVKTAMTELLKIQSETERIYCAGSLYLVGEIKAFLANR